MACMTDHRQGAPGAGGLDEFDALVGLDMERLAVALMLANSSASLDLLIALRAARERSGIGGDELARRLGTDARELLEEVEHLGGDPRLSSVLRYAGAVGATLELTVVEPAGHLTG